ncbi:MAG: hypothetical protein Q9219_001047 [cf. Caloplaca sp. 3 TL-2023]
MVMRLMQSSYTFLATALREVSEQGRAAFESGRANMNEIRENSEKTKMSILNIWDFLKETNTEAELYEIQLSNLEETSNTCKECAEKMHLDFATWLNFVSELHVSCQDTSSQSEADFRTFESKEKANEILRQQQEKLVGKAEATMKTFETQMTEQSAKYKDLMNKYPTGNDLLKQQLTMLAAETGAQLLQIGVTAAACSASPMAALGLAGKAAGDIKDTVKSSSAIADATKKDDTPAPTGESPVVIDPALARCEPVKNAVNHLKQLLRGGVGGTVDWDFMTDGGNAKTKGSSEKAQTATDGDTAPRDPAEAAGSGGDRKNEDSTTEKEGLDGAADEKSSDVGKQLLVVLESAISVSKAIQKEVEAATSSTTWTQPAKDSASVQQWASKIESAATTMIKLSSQSSSRPGAPNGRVPVVVSDPAAKEKVKARSDLNRDTLEAARSQLEISQKGLANTQDMFFKSSNKVLEVQEKLDKIRAEIKQLSEDKDTLNAVRDVLRSCIAFLGDLMDKISELVRFFSTIAILIRSAVNNAVTPYRKTLAVAAKQRATGTDYLSISMCNTIQQYSITIAASFSLYEDIGKLYVKINDDHLIRGITLVHAKTRKAIDTGAEVIQQGRIKEVEDKNPGVGFIAAPPEERKQAAGVLARAVDPEDDYSSSSQGEKNIFYPPIGGQSMMISEFEAPHVVLPTARHTHTIIALHGRGSQGLEFSHDLFTSFPSTPNHRSLPQTFPSAKWVFPSSQARYSTVFQEDLDEWFDVYSLTHPETREELQIKGLHDSIEFLLTLLKDEAREVGHERVILLGMSQGCATALMVLLASSMKLAAFVGLSGWMPFRAQIEDSIRTEDGLPDFFRSTLNLDIPPLPHSRSSIRNTPIFLGHNADDEIVDIELGRQAREVLQGLGMNVVWKEVPEGGHLGMLGTEGVDAIVEFIGQAMAITANT